VTRTDTENVGFLLAKASQRFNERLAARFAERGFGDVRASYGSVLVPLFEAGALRPGEIAARARLSKQSMTGLVKQCEAAGLVARERDPDDRRAYRVALTARGRRLQAVADEELAALDRELVARLGARRRDALIEALKGVMEL
jgi:MarR family transcriptional regulator, lower aerobic nicotinate degradation pathway regulator